MVLMCNSKQTPLLQIIEPDLYILREPQAPRKLL